MVDAALRDPGADRSALWASTPAATAARDQLGRLLAGGWFGPRPREVDIAALLLADLDPAVLDGALAGMDDAALSSLVRAVEGSGLPGSGWSLTRRHELWTLLGERLELDTFLRLTRLTDDLDPPPVAVADDDAMHPHQHTVYRRLDGRFAARGQGDAHPFDRSDLAQGLVGNCFMIAAIIAIADRDAGLLRRLMTRNPNGTVTVTFADGQRIVVAPTVAVHPDDGDPVFASRWLPDDRRDPVAGWELWPLLLEKAHAQRHGGWDGVDGGYPGDAIVELVGGETAELLVPADHDRLARHLAAGDVAVLATRGPERLDDAGRELLEKHDELASRHGFVVDAVAADGSLELTNPWYPHRGPLRLSPSQVAAIGHSIHVARVPATTPPPGRPATSASSRRARDAARPRPPAGGPHVAGPPRPPSHDDRRAEAR
jgi:hypothetical protein